MKRFIDIGANLTDPVFRGLYHGKQLHQDDYLLVLERAKKAGVQKIIITGSSLKVNQEALKLAKEDESLFTTVGCHPTQCKDFEKHPDGPDGYYNELVELINQPESKGKVVAIGECGLDYDRLHFCPIKTQLKYFERQFDLANMTGLPMFLHSRNTGTDFNDLIERNRAKFSTGVVHSFTGKVDEMQRAVDLGLYIGINGCSLKTAENLEVVKQIPEDRLMIETDAPWCEIRPTHASYEHLSKIPEAEAALYNPSTKKKERFVMGSPVKSRNEPYMIGQVLHTVAAIRDVDPMILAEACWNNTNKVFFGNS